MKKRNTRVAQLAAPVTTHLALTSAFVRKDSGALAQLAQVGIELKIIGLSNRQNFFF